MSKPYWVQFGSGNPQSFAGLTPTFILFISNGGTAMTPPSIAEAGVSTGLYTFMYEPNATFAIAFTVDGGSSIAASSDRYITGVLDAVSAVDERIGQTVDSFGSTSVDPSTLLGYVKRIQEFLEGDATFTKATASWQISSRGSSTLLRTKSLTNTVTSATKTGQ